MQIKKLKIFFFCKYFFNLYVNFLNNLFLKHLPVIFFVYFQLVEIRRIEITVEVLETRILTRQIAPSKPKELKDEVNTFLNKVTKLNTVRKYIDVLT